MNETQLILQITGVVFLFINGILLYGNGSYRRKFKK